MKSLKKHNPNRQSGSSWTEIELQGLTKNARGLFRVGFWVAAAATGIGMTSLSFNAPQLLFAFACITIPAVVGLGSWAWSRGLGLPLLPLFIGQQALIYGLPVALRQKTVTELAPDTVTKSGLAIGLFLVCVAVGGTLGKSWTLSRPSRGNIALGKGGGRSLSLAYMLLGVALLFHLATRTGLMEKMLPGPLMGLFPVIRTFAGAASMLGAMLGGMAVGRCATHVRNWIYWALVLIIGILSVADILLSAASGLVLSAGVGLALGRGRIPWKFLAVSFCIVGFLNQGKFVMRDRYWNETSNMTSTTLLMLPQFYGEWTAASSELLFSGETSQETDDGQSILERVDSFQNMTFVVESIVQRKIRTLNGETYTLIPPLFIPRIFWPDKPRVHEGQILLNLHFGRQGSVEQTEKTYIAWGLLPEAIGNFGLWLGPIVMGVLFGVVMGWLEGVSRRKRLFSIEGMMLATLLLLMVTSYEMVASVLLTAVFQSMIAVIVGGWVLMRWFKDTKAHGQPQGRRTRQRIEQKISNRAAPLSSDHE